MSARASTVVQTGGTWAFRDGQVLPDASLGGQPVTISQNVRNTPYGVASSLDFSGFDLASGFDPGSALEVVVTTIPDLAGDAVTAQAIAYTNTAQTAQVSGTGAGALTLYWPALAGVDPTDPSFSVSLTCSSAGALEIAQVTALSAQPQAPVNTAQPVVTTNYAAGTITTTNGGWDAFPSPAYTYLWSNGQTTQTATLSPTDAGNVLSCVVTATNVVGANSATSTTVGPFFAPNFINASLFPTTLQTLADGSQIPVGGSSIRSSGTLDTQPFTATYSWAWHTNGTLDPAQTGSDYTPTLPAQYGVTLTVNITVTTPLGSDTTPTMTYQLPSLATSANLAPTFTAGTQTSSNSMPALAWGTTNHDTAGWTTAATQYNYTTVTAPFTTTNWLKVMGLGSSLPTCLQVLSIGLGLGASFNTPDTQRYIGVTTAVGNVASPYLGTGNQTAILLPATLIASASTSYSNTFVVPSAGLPIGTTLATGFNFGTYVVFATNHAVGANFSVGLSTSVVYTNEPNFKGYTISA